MSLISGVHRGVKIFHNLPLPNNSKGGEVSLRGCNSDNKRGVIILSGGGYTFLISNRYYRIDTEKSNNRLLVDILTREVQNFFHILLKIKGCMTFLIDLAVLGGCIGGCRPISSGVQKDLGGCTLLHNFAGDGEYTARLQVK